MRKRALDWLDDLTFTASLWFSIRDLAKERGFLHPKARQGPDPNRNYVFMSGLSVKEVLGLKTEIEAGGWSHSHTSRKRHFFSKPYEIFDNPSLCKRHKLDFITALEHDFEDEDKCQICFKSYKRKKIVQVIAPQELALLMLEHLPTGLEMEVVSEND